MAIYRLRVLNIKVHNIYLIIQKSYQCQIALKTPKLYKIAFLFQMTSNFSELTADLSGVRFERGRAALVPSISSRFQSPVAHLTVSRARFCGPVSFHSAKHH